MDELNGRLIACQLLAAGLVARMANQAADTVAGMLDVRRGRAQAVTAGVRIEGVDDEARVRAAAQRLLDELFALMKPPAERA